MRDAHRNLYGYCDANGIFAVCAMRIDYRLCKRMTIFAASPAP